MHNNKKCCYHGYKFDSYAERDDYIYQLSLYGVQKVIIKPRFILQKSFTSFNNHKIRPITFTPDLLIIFNNKYYDIHRHVYEIRDTKPFSKKKNKFITEPVFDLKWKMLKYLAQIMPKLYYTSLSGNGNLSTALSIKFTLTS